jgi:hypothetical protein
MSAPPSPTRYGGAPSCAKCAKSVYIAEQVISASLEPEKGANEGSDALEALVLGTSFVLFRGLERQIWTDFERFVALFRSFRRLALFTRRA